MESKPAATPMLIAMFVAAAVVGASAATHTVTDSISLAISNAHPGDTVVIPGPRVYREQIVINKPLRVIGTNSPIIDAGGSNHTINITAEGVKITGITARNSGKDLNTLDSAIMITGDRATIRHCRTENDAFGIYLRGASECVIEQNEITGDPAWTPSLRGNGIHLWKTKKNRITSNVICDKRDGIYFSFADRNLIGGNRIHDTRFAIHYMYSHFNQLLTNTFTRNSVGATLMFSQWSNVEGNFVFANRRHGMVFKQLDNSTIRRNIITGQNRGLFVQQAAQCRFEGNVISTNDIGVYLSNGSEQNIFTANAFIQNTDHVWQPPYEADMGRRGPNQFYEKGRGNFWSDYTGTDAAGDGIGDTPYHETDVYGYVLDRFPEARVFALSPALAALRKGEELLPLLDTLGVTDLYPMMKPFGAGAGSTSHTLPLRAGSSRGNETHFNTREAHGVERDPSLLTSAAPGRKQ